MKSHPTDESLAAFAEGRVTAEERRAILEHIDVCADCCSIVQGDWEAMSLGEIEDPRAQGGSVVHAHFGARRVLLPAAIAAAALVAVVLSPPVQKQIAFQRDGGVSLIAKAANEEKVRPIHSRLTGGFAYKPPLPNYRGGGDDDAAEERYALPAAVADVEERAGSSTSVKDIRALAIAYLMSGLRAEAVEKFEEALSLARDPDVQLLNDASAAHAELARYTHDPRQVHAKRALELADRAWSTKHLPEIAWNRAVAKAALAPNDAAEIAAWNEYLSVDSQSPWAAEARENISRVQGL
ncbi:MAG TPA: zf-HC2 domain-containing protein [Thermoanaerobaculia bacterium]|nr:zf-HC2 domain-containing protein [Thermoanaerobaculia bacterium]